MSHSHLMAPHSYLTGSIWSAEVTSISSKRLTGLALLLWYFLLSQ